MKYQRVCQDTDDIYLLLKKCVIQLLNGLYDHMIFLSARLNVRGTLLIRSAACELIKDSEKDHDHLCQNHQDHLSSQSRSLMIIPRQQ